MPDGGLHGHPGHPRPRRPQLGLEMVHFGPHGIGTPKGSVARIIHKIPDGPIYAGKTRILGSKTRFPLEFLDFLSISWICLGICKISLEILGNSKVDPPKKGCEVDFGRRGKLRCHRIDEFFKQNWVPRPSQAPQEAPQEASQEGLKNIVYFLFF